MSDLKAKKVLALFYCLLLAGCSGTAELPPKLQEMADECRAANMATEYDFNGRLGMFTKVRCVPRDKS